MLTVLRSRDNDIDRRDGTDCEVVQVPGKRGYRPSEVLLHISGKTTYQALTSGIKAAASLLRTESVCKSPH
jgi:hypothetical protein